MKYTSTLHKLIFTIAFFAFTKLSFSQSNHTVSFTGNTSDFNAVEKYSSVDNVDYYVTFDATYVYFGAFRNGGNSWASMDHFTIYVDHFGVGAGSATGVNWDGNTPTLPFAADYRIAIRNNSSGESFLSSHSGSWTTGAANAQGWTQNTSAAADGGLEVRIPWADIGNPNAIRFFTYASFSTGYYGYAPSGASGVGPSGASQWFGTIGTKSADCIPTNTTNLNLTGTGTLTNAVPAAAGTYARVTVNAGTITNLNAWTLAPGGILEVTGGTFAIGAQTITFGNATTANGKGTTISTSGTGALTTIATTVLTFGGEGNIIGNNLSTNGTIRILNKFTPLASGGLTFNSGAALDIRANGYVSSYAPNYAAGANLNYNTGGNYSAATEWISNIATGIGVPSNVNVGNLVAASQLDFGSDVQFRRLTGNLTLSATSTLSLSSSSGGDLQIGGNFNNTAGAVFNHNNRIVTFNGTVAQNLNSSAVIFDNLTIANTTATVTALANTTIATNLTIDANARLNIAATTLTITGATTAINGFLRSAGTITGASPATLVFNSGGSYEHNYTTTLGVIPSATWNAGSNCQIIGYTTALTATGANGYSQNFSNFTWNCTNQGATAFNLASQLTSVADNFSVLSTGATGSLNLSNTASTVITIGGNFNQSAGICNISTAATTVNVSGDFVQSGGTVTISNTAAIISTLNISGNVTKSGGTLIVSSNTGAAQMIVSGNFSQSLGTTTVSSSTGAPQLNITGTFSQSGGTSNVSTAASGVAQMNINSTFTISGGTFNVSTAAAPSLLNVSGDVINSGGTLNIGATGVAQLNANSNYIQNSGITNISTGAGAALLNVKGSFTFSGGNLTKTVSGVIVGTITFNGVVNQNVNITDPTNITNAISFRLNNANGITVVNGSTMPINTLGSFRKTLGDVTLSGTGAIVYNAINSSLIYDGVSDVSTSSNEWPLLNGPVNVSIAHTALSNISLHAPRTLTGVLSLGLNNRLILGANDLTVANTASGAISPAIGTATQMVVAEGAGRLIRSITTGISYTWPIGDMTGTIEYSPVIINFTSTSVARDIGFNVVNATHPQMNNPDPQTNYRNRYFGVYNSTGGNYTYTPTCYFLVADNIGAFANVKLNSYDGASWVQAPLTTSIATNSTTTGTVDETTFPLNSGNHIVCRSKPQIYVWNESSGGTQSWAVATNWTPSRVAPNFDDILMFSNGGTSTANAIPTQSIGKIIVSNNTTVTLVPAVTATLTLTGGTGNDFEIASGSSLTIGGAPAAVPLTIAHLAGAANIAQIDGVVSTGTNLSTNAYLATNSTTNINGVFNNNGIFTCTTSTTNINGSLNSIAGTITSTAANLIINSGGTYNHNRNGGPIPTSLWDVNSNCNINGITNTMLTAGLNQTFGNFTWNCTAQSASLIMGANVLTTVNGNLSFLSTNNQFLSISSTASNIAVGGNLLIDINTGTLRLNSANVAININLSGNFTHTSGTFSRFAGAAIVAVNFLKTTGLQTISQASGLFSGILNWNIGTGASTNTLKLLTNVDLGGSASPFTVNQNATLDCGTFVLSNSTAVFTLSNTVPGATIITANANGIELVGAIGSIQTTGARVYSANANYMYNGTINQNTGLGLTTVNNLFIDNNTNVNLSTNVFVNGITTFTNGKIILNSFNFNATNSAGNPFIGISATNYFVTNGSGQLIRSIATAGLPINYQFPVGDISNFTPSALNFSANSIARDIGVIVTPGAVPNNLPSPDYINRSWTFTNSSAGTYTYIPTFTYAPADVIGTAANMKISRYIGPLWNEYNATPNTIVAPPNMTLTGSLNEITGQLSSYWTGRLYPAAVSYTWNGSTSNDWNTPTNWTPNGVPGIIDNLLINTAASNPCVANGVFFGANNFNLSGTGNFQLTAGSVLTVNGNLSYVNTASATFNCSSTLNISSPTSQNIPALNYGNLNLTGGDRVLAAAGTIGVCGLYTTGIGAITITGSTINYNGTSAQTITSANYNNLIISQNRGGALITLQPGTIVVNNNFTPSLTSYTAFVDGNTFNFNGGPGQIIPAFYYFNITSANATRTWANSGIIDVKGTFSPAAIAVNTITGSTVRFSSTLPNINLSAYTTNTANRNFNNVIFDGIGGSWNAGAVNLRTTGTLTVNNGTVNVATAAASTLIVNTTTTINGGTLNISSDVGIGTATFTGALTVNGGQVNIANGTTAAGTGTATAAAINVNGGLFVVSNSIAAGTLTQSGILTINGGTFRMTTAAGAATVNLNSDLTQTSGSFVRAGSGVASCIIGGGFAATRNWTQGVGFTMTGLTTFTISGTFTTLRLMSDINIGNATININSGYFINLQGFVISGGAGSIYRSYNGSRFTTSHVGGVALAPAATGCIQTATRYFGGSLIWTFNGSSPQITGTAFPGSVDGLTLNNAAGLTLSVPMRIQNTNNLTLSNGSITLGNFNLTLEIGATIGGGANSATKMIITNGTGMLVKIFSGTGSYTYPIGDNTGTAEYSPVTLNFTALSSLPDSVGMRVTDAQHPNDLSVTNYLSRYWSCNQIASANYTYTATFRYLDADIVGIESVLKVDRWSNPLTSWTQDASSTVTVASNTLTTSSLNQTTGTLLNNDFASRSDAPFYYQTSGSGNWSDISIWEVSTDPLFLTPLPVAAGVAPNAVNSLGITIKNTHSVTVAASTDADQMIISSTGQLNVSSGQTFTVGNGTGVDLIVNGTINNSGIIGVTGTIEFNNSSYYYHTQNGGTIPTSTWNTGSTCEINGITNTPPSGLNQTFYNLNWNCSGQTTPIHLSGNLTSISNDFTMLSTNSTEVRLFDNTTSGTLSIGGDLIFLGGEIAIVNSATSGAGNAIVNVNGNLSLSGSGAINMSGSSAATAGGSNLNVQGDFSVGGSAYIHRTQNTPSVVTLNKLTGTQNFTISPMSISTSDITWRIGDGSTTNTVVLNSGVTVGSTATFRLMSGATLDCSTFVINGGVFENQATSNLILRSADGINNFPSLFGNIQTNTRTFVSGGNYTYGGAVSQTTGTALPLTITGNLTISNNGIAGNNIVSITNNGITVSNLVLNSGVLAIGNAQQMNIANGGNVNAVAGDFAVGTTAGTLNFNGTGTFTGNCSPYNVFIAGAVNFGTGTVSIQNGGTLRINNGGSIATNAAYYSTNSILQYNVNSNFNRGLEWSAASGRGFPYHVQLSNNSVLNAAGAGAINAAVTFNMAGDLTIDAGSTLAMNFGGNNMTVPLNVAGDITFSGNLSASGASGGNIALGGDWNNNGAAVINFLPNNRNVIFNGSAIQTIAGSNTTINPFAELTINNATGVNLSVFNIEINSALNLLNGKLNLNNNQLTLGTAGSNGLLTGGSVTSYVISGNALEKFVRYTTTNNTTYNFPVGDALNYTPISVQFYTSPMAANTQLSVNLINAAHPNLGSSTNYLNRYWTVEPTNLPNTLTDYGVTYQYADADIVGVEANLKPYKHSTVGWIAANGSGAQFEMGTGSVNPGTNTISWTGLNNFSDFTGNGNGSPLPIQLLNFDAQLVINSVELTWSTLTETNNDYFTIERSHDAHVFSDLAKIPGAGNSNELLNYKLIDEQPLVGKSYYRLKQTDYDGKHTYSEIKSVNSELNTNVSSMNLYPNPSNLNGFFIQIPDKFVNSHFNIQVNDIYGKLVYECHNKIQNQNASFFISLENQDLPNGIYHVNLIQNDVIQTIKLTIVD